MPTTADSLIDDLIAFGRTSLERIQAANYLEPDRSDAFARLCAHIVVRSIEIRREVAISVSKISEVQDVILEVNKHIVPRPFTPGTQIRE
jgi:hypothetical protein